MRADADAGGLGGGGRAPTARSSKPARVRATRHDAGRRRAAASARKNAAAARRCRRPGDGRRAPATTGAVCTVSAHEEAAPPDAHAPAARTMKLSMMVVMTSCAPRARLEHARRWRRRARRRRAPASDGAGGTASGAAARPAAHAPTIAAANDADGELALGADVEEAGRGTRARPRGR